VSVCAGENRQESLCAPRVERHRSLQGQASEELMPSELLGTIDVGVRRNRGPGDFIGGAEYRQRGLARLARSHAIKSTPKSAKASFLQGKLTPVSPKDGSAEDARFW
jgi:hypothetical protein